MMDFENTYISVTFASSGRGKARCPSNPDYPHGIAIPRPDEGVYCFVALPYPAPECGLHLVQCHRCGATTAVTAAGRPDDPVSCYIPCRFGKEV
jgi:hypothetical protein